MAKQPDGSDDQAEEIYALKKDLMRRLKSIVGQHRHALKRLSDAEERIGELEATLDEVKHALRERQPSKASSPSGSPVIARTA